MITFSSYNLLDFSIIWKVVLLRTVPFFSYIFSFFPQCQKFVNGIVTAHNEPNNCWQFLSVTHDFRGKYYSGAKKKQKEKKKNHKNQTYKTFCRFDNIVWLFYEAIIGRPVLYVMQIDFVIVKLWWVPLFQSKKL